MAMKIIIMVFMGFCLIQANANFIKSGVKGKLCDLYSPIYRYTISIFSLEILFEFVGEGVRILC
jgi:hypothetical protein